MTKRKTHKQIAKEFDTSVSTVRRRQTVRRNTKYSEEERQEVLAMLAEGMTPAEISHMLDIPRTSIINWRNKK